MNDDVVQLLVEANSIQDPEDLRLPQSEVDARCDAIVTRRLTMTSTPTPVAPHATKPPHQRRSMAWAFAAGFVVILLVVGAATLFLRGDTQQVADEPAPLPSITSPATPTTGAADDGEFATDIASWQRIGTEAASLIRGENASIQPLPGGGFVAASEQGNRPGSVSPTVIWSSDGLDWFDGDPQRLVPSDRRGMAVVADQVIILVEEDDGALALWIGDPTTGTWEPMLLDTSGLEGELWIADGSMAASSDALLLAASSHPPYDEPPVDIGPVVVWLVDPEKGTASRTTLPVHASAEVFGPTAWFDGRWHVMLPVAFADWWVTETALWSSADGTTWTKDELPQGWRLPALYFVTAGSSGVVTCAVIEGNEETADTWFSPNGIDWQLIGRAGYCRGVYSDALGFVLERSGNGFYRLSPDGTTLEELDSPFDADTVAASGNNLIVASFPGSNYSAADAWSYGLWLYRQPDNE